MTSNQPKDRQAEMGLGSKALAGVLFVGASGVAVKGFSFLAQLALGWILAKDDFKLWAMVMSLTTFTGGIKGGGASKYLLQRGVSSLSDTRSVFHYCVFFNVLAAIILIVASLFASHSFGAAQIVPLALWMAITMVLNSPTEIGRSRLSVEGRFRELANLDTITRVVHFSLMIVLAFAGAGALSFVVPGFLSALFSWAVFARALGPMPMGGVLNWARFREIFSSGKWIILAGFAASLSATGDYLIIAKFAPEALSDYFFGFQLTLVVSAVVIPGMLQVLTPTFAKLNDEPQRLASAYMRVVRSMPFLSTSLCVSMALLSPALVHFAWQGKWDAAIPVVQVMSLNVSLRLLGAIYASLLQGRGEWSRFAIWHLIEGMIVVFASCVGTQLGGLMAIAITVGLFRSITPLVYTVIVGRMLGVSARLVFKTATVRIVIPMIVAGIVWSLVRYAGLPSISWAAFIIYVIALTTSLGLLGKFVFSEEIIEVVNMLQRNPRTIPLLAPSPRSEQ